MDTSAIVADMCQRARASAQVLARTSTGAKNSGLMRAADALEANREQLLAANAADMAAARTNALEAPLLDRLKLTEARITAMADGVRQVAALPDPVGEISGMHERPSGIEVGRMRVPLGVIGIIYESRPNVSADAGVLCCKSGNAVILRGGSEALNSNRIIADCLRDGLRAAELPEDGVQLVQQTDRELVSKLIGTPGNLDMVIPRGGRGLIERIQRDSQVPVLKHLDGVCHVYIDAAADPDMATAIAVNAKTRRYGVCNAMETLLIDRAIAERVSTRVDEALR